MNENENENKNKNKLLITAFAAFAAFAAFSGCADPIEEEEEGTPQAEACEHTIEGPANAVTATATLEGAPDVSAAHTRHDVTLVDVPAGDGDGADAAALFGGFVRFESKGGQHLVFFTRDVPVAYARGDGTALDVEAERASETTCAEVVASDHIELPVGIVALQFKATSAQDVSLVIEGEHESDEESAGAP